MKSIIATLLSLIVLIGSLNTSNAFTSVSNFAHLASIPKESQTMTTTSLNVFGTRKTAAQKAEEQAKTDLYWEGEWVCADCGYIYNRFECAGLFFEEQGAGFRCPQCSGPRRRYAKKVGDVVGTTLDGGDFPILAFSIGGLLGTIWFGVWAVENL